MTFELLDIQSTSCVKMYKKESLILEIKNCILIPPYFTLLL